MGAIVVELSGQGALPEVDTRVHFDQGTIDIKGSSTIEPDDQIVLSVDIDGIIAPRQQGRARRDGTLRFDIDRVWNLLNIYIANLAWRKTRIKRGKSSRKNKEDQIGVHCEQSSPVQPDLHLHLPSFPHDP